MKYFVAKEETRKLNPVVRTTLRGSYIALSDGITQYELKGPSDGELVLMMGGLTVPLSFWDTLVAPLNEAGFRTLTFSGYGRGYSDRLTGRYDENLFIRQVTELLNALGLKPDHILGSSMGAIVACTLAIRDSNDISTLTLIGPGGLGRAPAAVKLLRFDPLGNFVAQKFGRRILEGHQSHNVLHSDHAMVLRDMIHDAFTFEGSLYALFSTLRCFPLFERLNLYRQLGKSAIPILLLWGADDAVTPLSYLNNAEKLLRPEDVHVVHNCGHMVSFERPDEVTNRFFAFAEKHR